MAMETIYAVICSGQHKASINGEEYIADKVEVLAGFSTQKKALDFLKDNPDVKEPDEWGIRAISVYPVEVKS